MTEENQKQTLLSAANQYEPKTTKNISELKQFELTHMTELETFEDNQGKQYTATVMIIEGERYRVPNSVLAQIKKQIKTNPNLQRFTVDRQGTTINDTVYTVVPLL